MQKSCRIGTVVAVAAALFACGTGKDEHAGNEVAKSANAVQDDSKKAQRAAKPAAGKCPSFYTQLPPQTPDLTRKVYTCVERYSVLYAKGPDSAETLSKAVMAKCRPIIVEYVDQEAKKHGVRPPYKEAFESWQGHTLPIIAEARARRCFD